jgi:hypothetical protein
MLRQQGHRDFEQWVVEVEALQSEYEDSANLLDLWEALVAARDFVAALGLIQAMPLDLERNDGSTFAGLSNSDVARALTYWFLEQDEPLNDLLIRMRSELDELRNPNGSVQRVSAMLGGALLAVLEGNTAEAERQIRRWQRVAPSDLAELATQRHHACRMLGMAGATAATVECIRATLVKPSYAMPFIEPFLPYYDSIRAEQAFVDLLAELEPAD